MVFFGTPFRGAGELNQAEMIQAAQSQYEEDQVQEAVLNILASGNESLMDLTADFFKNEVRRGQGLHSLLLRAEIEQRWRHPP